MQTSNTRTKIRTTADAVRYLETLGYKCDHHVANNDPDSPHWILHNPAGKVLGVMTSSCIRAFALDKAHQALELLGIGRMRHTRMNGLGRGATYSTLRRWSNPASRHV